MRYSSLPPRPEFGEDLSSWDDGSAEARSITSLRLALSGGKLKDNEAIPYDHEDIKLVESAPHGKFCPVTSCDISSIVVWLHCPS